MGRPLSCCSHTFLFCLWFLVIFVPGVPPKSLEKFSRSRDRSWEVWGEGLEGWLFIIGLYHLVTDPKLEIGARGAGSECVSWDGEGQPPGSGSAGCSRQHVMP